MTGVITSAQEAVEKIFENLDTWRKLPKYQLERRADMFFGLYVKDIVENLLETEKPELSDIVIPEFPIGKNIIETLKREKNPRLPEYDPTLQSVNVDYALFSKDVVYFIELKTDMGSRNSIQDEYLEYAHGQNIRIFVEHIKTVAKPSNNPKSWKKYRYLLDQLELMDVHASDAKIEVIYIQPKKYTVFEGAKCIPFSEICGWLEKQNGDFPKLFAKYLCQWQ